ncbi:MAG TPA: threonylcarbamoyl-AMP synthase [Candidatus Agrococcus pullicola]|uniref:L-threonylcarbamoyladenylate synthase n=1 Tax=Candidatus Agrococcus pullicola TaxID=2838429 RepID=A0A9D2C7P3_9MICO|nr:threonylcarbamoyl-AMP synthase [Candidatus Agrococcus pullicola]
MPETFDLTDSSQLLAGMRSARKSIGRGALIIMPTDTVYGVAADAFTPLAVAALLAAKGRDRTSPPPVLIPNRATGTALAEHIPEALEPLLEEYWPGPLTVIVRARPQLGWDLGETNGTVALRIPDQPLAIELLEDTGPLAVSSANLHGLPAPKTAGRAASMLGGAIEVVLDAGEVGERYEPHEKQNGSTIIDASRADGLLRIVRQGVLSRDTVAQFVGDALVDADYDERIARERAEAAGQNTDGDSSAGV